MGTLYDLLGALPDDDAEGLRTAFRKAAKASHPDINPDDPDAPQRFRQLVRAHDILSEPEQRATYDLLLTVALRETDSNSKRSTIYETIHRHASNTVAATIIAGMMVGGYALFGPASKPPVISEKAIETAARGPAATAAEPPAGQAIGTEPREAHERRAITDAVMLASAVEPAASPQAFADVEPAPKPAVTDAKSYRQRGVFAYRDGDLYRALADFDLAIEHDPGFADAYVDRSIVWYRMREFNRAYADLAQAKRIANPVRTRTSAAALRKALAVASPVKTRHALKD